MNVPPNLDPFHVLDLSEDIEGQCQRIVARDLRKVVDEEALRSLKVPLRNHMVSLLTEMLNEWRHLAEQSADASIFNETWVIPGVPEMIQQIPLIYISPPEDHETRKTWLIERVRWVISSWLQMWGQLSAYWPKTDDEYTPVVAPSPEPSLALVTQPFQLHAMLRIWQMLRVLTLEYMAKKADLLNDLGQNDCIINVDDEMPDLLLQAKEAFWNKRSDAPLMLVHAMRNVLLVKLNARDQLRTITVQLSTSSLVAMAENAGLSFPHPAEVLIKIITNLENQQNLDERIEISFLYPIFRILTDTVEQLQSAKDDKEVQLRASVIIDQIAKQFDIHENHSQD